MDTLVQQRHTENRDNMRPGALHTFWQDMRTRYPAHVILMQVGDFYEAFGEDASRVADLLSLSLSSRMTPTGERTPMCGFPTHLERKYVTALCDAGRKVLLLARLATGAWHIFDLALVAAA